MRSLLHRSAGEPLALTDYYADFEKHFWSCGGLGFWKLERQQTFKEPGYDSWEAFWRGDWDEALRLLDAGRADMAEYHRKVEAHGFAARRARVVQEPLSAYMQWEMHALLVRDQCGGPVHVTHADKVVQYEEDGQLPEICTLGSQVMYQALYDDQGVLTGALKFVDPQLVASCREFIVDIYNAGEPLADWFSSHVAPLPPPPRQAKG